MALENTAFLVPAVIINLTRRRNWRGRDWRRRDLRVRVKRSYSLF
jgi:hypothetical protein